MRKFQDLDIWKRSHALTLEIYRVTQQFFPKDELFALTSQIRRASASIPTNIAEGCGRSTSPDFNRFLQIASGSTTEVEYQLLLARDLSYITEEIHAKLSTEIVEIRKMITAFSKNIPTFNART